MYQGNYNPFKELKKICKKEKLTLHEHQSDTGLSPSTYHGSCVNWAYQNVMAEDGYVLISHPAVSASATSTKIVSTAFASTGVPTTSRIVVFEENGQKKI